MMPTNLQQLHRNDSIHECLCRKNSEEKWCHGPNAHFWLLWSGGRKDVQKNSYCSRLLIQPNICYSSATNHASTQCNGERLRPSLRMRTLNDDPKKASTTNFYGIRSTNLMTTSLSKHVIYCINKCRRVSLLHKTLNKFLSNVTCYCCQGTNTHAQRKGGEKCRCDGNNGRSSEVEDGTYHIQTA